VIDFKSSSETADDAVNRGTITLSWKTENADYVELSCKCLPAPKGPSPGVMISEGSIERGCENNLTHLYSYVAPNHSPSSSVAVMSGNFMQAQPISITVLLTPSSHATPYPAAAKSVTVGVAAFNPHSIRFRRGYPPQTETSRSGIRR
jgi:hypothetical protein